jgi:hypothetical protein
VLLPRRPAPHSWQKVRQAAQKTIALHSHRAEQLWLENTTTSNVADSERNLLLEHTA